MAIITPGLQSSINKYIKFERIEKHKKYIEDLVEKQDVSNLTRLVGKRLSFGTAGIRGNMGPGFAQMNDLVIIQTSQGLASYLLKEPPKRYTIEKSVVIGHDARHNSDRFARLTALAFLQKGFKVYFCDDIIPTPFVAYAVTKYHCCAGIVITASHNPKNDNGYKVYGSNGAQILSPIDKFIQDQIVKESNQEPWPKAWQHDLILPSSASSLPEGWEIVHHGKDISAAYFRDLKDQVINKHVKINSESNLRITYTTMHGVGHYYLTQALKIAGFENIFPVELQQAPDPDFPTVKFPNPEEAGALDLAIETAKETDSELIVANDPDADRCAAAIYNPSTGQHRVFNGNEIGFMLGAWAWENHEENHEDDQFVMISTAVSSRCLESMATHEDFEFIETLTGFKYMGNLAQELDNEGKTLLLAFEEAIGYMVNNNIRDKDGISAAVQLAQLAASLACRKKTLEQYLDSLHIKYGYHYSSNSYFICHDQSKIAEIFKKLQSDYPSSFGDSFPVRRVRDLNLGYDSGEALKYPKLPCSAGSFMVTFFIDKDIRFTIRTSGTEPKIKYYSEIVADLPDTSNNDIAKAKIEAQNRLNKLVALATDYCLEPERNNLQPAVK